MKRRLDQSLVSRGLAVSRHQAQSLIGLGKVKVDGKLVGRPSYLVEKASEIALTDQTFVARSAYKLASVSQKLGIEFRTKILLDVGAATGGFTEFALQNDAAKVYAVDVGRRQLAASLRKDPRVVSMEKTDIRNVKLLPEPVDLILVDVSFISVRLILGGLVPLIKTGGQIVVMVKPQFEADDPKLLNDGIVKNDRLRRQILKDFEIWARQFFRIIAKADSVVSGRKGNIERFSLLKPIRR